LPYILTFAGHGYFVVPAVLFIVGFNK